MAIITIQQQKEILNSLPPNLNAKAVFQGLIDKGNQLEGFNDNSPSNVGNNNIEEEKPKEKGFFRSVVEGVTGPFRKGLASGVRSLQATPEILSGNFDKANEIMSQPLFGSKTLVGSSNLENLGTAANAGSFLLPGGKFLGGAVGAGGSTLEEGGNVQDALVTGVTGGLLTRYAPGVAKKLYNSLPDNVSNTISRGVNSVSEMVTKPFAEIYNSLVSAPIRNSIEPKLISSIEKTNNQILNFSKSELNKQSLSGKNLARFLAEENIPIQIMDGKVLGQKTIENFKPIVQTENAVLNAILENEPAVLTIDDIANKAISNLKSSGVDLGRAKTYLGQQLDALITQNQKGFFKTDKTLAGNLATWNKIKAKAWENTVDFMHPDKNIINDANSSLGYAIKDLIESKVDDVDVKAINQRLGQWQDAISALIKRDGTKVPPARISNLFNGVVGVVIGTSAGGPTGGVVGALGAEKIASIFSNPSIQQDIKYSILKELQSSPQGSEVIKNAQKVLGQKLEDIISGKTKALPPVSTIFAQPGSDKSGAFYDPTPDITYQNNIKRLPEPKETIIYAGGRDRSGGQLVEARRSIQRNPKTGRMQRIYTGEAK